MQLSHEKIPQRLNIAYCILSKSDLTNEYVRWVSSNQVIDELNKTI